jgi:serine/threonine-protein kinase
MSEPERESRVGSRIGRYHLMRLLGKGGMGEVYEAEDTVKDRIVALKLLPESVSHDPVFRKRLQREAHSAGRLQEPHVVPIHDYGEIDGLLYVDMRMINGTDLRKMLKRFGPIAPARAVAIVRQVASALDAAHEAGVIHRDVKPENILITRDDFVYLVDFGIANAATDERLTELGTAVGTYAYMAPERFTNAEVTYRADIYALACVLHECLVGSQPYPGDSVSVIITAHLMEPTPRPSEMRPGIPKAFDDVIARGMAKKPDDRYASAGDLAQAANDALTSRDQDQAATILERSAAATLPGQIATAVSPSSGPAPPTLPATPAPTPRPAPPTPPHVGGETGGSLLHATTRQARRSGLDRPAIRPAAQSRSAQTQPVDPSGRRGRGVRRRAGRSRHLVGRQTGAVDTGHADHHNHNRNHRDHDTDHRDLAHTGSRFVRREVARAAAQGLQRDGMRASASTSHRRAGHRGLRVNQDDRRPDGGALHAVRRPSQSE